MTETDHLYLDRQGQRDLRDTLATIPALAEDLAVTITGQDRRSRPGATGYRKRRRLDGSTPVNDDAFDDYNALHNALTTWVRHCCEHDDQLTPPSNDLVSLARWLTRHIPHLARTEGAEGAPTDISDRVLACGRHIDLPPEDPILSDPERHAQANKSIVTVGTIDSIARRLGDLGEGLNGRRMRTLCKSAGLAAVSQDEDTGTKFYRLGDVLDAHHRHRTRRDAIRRDAS